MENLVGRFGIITREHHSIIATYVLMHAKTGSIYVGSTNNLYNRINRHKCLLRVRKHSNKNLQKLYDNSTEFSIMYTAHETIEAALDNEQRLLDKNRDNLFLINVAVDVHRPALGNNNVKRAWSETSKRNWSNPEHRRKMAEVFSKISKRLSKPITISGVTYPSRNIAAKSLNISRHCLQYRLSKGYYSA